MLGPAGPREWHFTAYAQTFDGAPGSMLALDSPLWRDLKHAYGEASDLPALLARATVDPRPGHLKESAWFDLWSSLCHQDDVYSASYAAVPHLVAIASTRRGLPEQFDPLHLTAYIELNRLEGSGPAVPAVLAAPYRDALRMAKALAEEALERSWPKEDREALTACIAALEGRTEEARALFDADGDENDEWVDDAR